MKNNMYGALFKVQKDLTAKQNVNDGEEALFAKVGNYIPYFEKQLKGRRWEGFLTTLNSSEK